MDFFKKINPVYFEDCNNFNRTEVKNEKCLYYLIKYAHFHLTAKSKSAQDTHSWTIQPFKAKPEPHTVLVVSRRCLKFACVRVMMFVRSMRV